jgi:cytochrome c oxidase subunit I+III
VFPLIGGIYYWFPKMTGRMMDDRLGKWNFAVLFVGFNVTFFPMHILGIEGMPRRVYTYPAEMGWGLLNFISTLGAIMLMVGGVIFIYNVARSYRGGAIAGDNPWNADTLEWGTSSPPPVYNFLHMPVVEGRNALWDRSAAQPIVTGIRSGIRSDCREVLITDVMDAEPSNKNEYPTPTIWPFLAAVATSAFFITSIFTPWALVVFAVPITITLIFWFWPHAPGHDIGLEDEAPRAARKAA